VFVGDDGRVAQILLNVLSNAVKFTAPGGAVAASWGRARPEELPGMLAATRREYLYIRVSDNGIGIAADKLEDIFEPFVQVDSSHSRQQGGTGLGLAISRKLARLMDGELTVVSSPGAGSTFTLWLPAAPPSEPRPATRPTSEARAEIARILLGCTEAITLALVRRLREDPTIPFARDAATTELENHVQSFLADIFQHVAIIDDPAADRTLLIRDGSHIQHMIADLHGAQRAHLGWTEAALRREFELLVQEVERIVRQTLADRALATDADEFVTLLQAFLGDAARVSVEGFAAARRRRAAVGAGADASP
jgi:histone H3/H4